MDAGLRILSGLDPIGGVVRATPAHVVAAATASTNADTYRLLNLFGDVVEKVKSDYVEVPDQQKMIDSDPQGGVLVNLEADKAVSAVRRIIRRKLQEEMAGAV